VDITAVADAYLVEAERESVSIACDRVPVFAHSDDRIRPAARTIKACQVLRAAIAGTCTA
jgi:hypothetical protein